MNKEDGNKITVSERLNVNAAITTIIEEENMDLDSFKTIVDFGHRLPENSQVQLDGFSRSSGGENFSGHTSAGFDMNLSDHKESQRSFSLGVTKECVGNFKIWKNPSGTVIFQHFWGSEIGSMVDDEDEPITYFINYDLKTLKPESFGFYENVLPFSLVTRLVKFLTGYKMKIEVIVLKQNIVWKIK